MSRARNAPKLPGVDEQKSIPEITESAVMLRKQGAKLQKLRGTVGDLKAAVIAKMKEHKLTVYRDEECSPVLVVRLKTGKEGLEFVEESGDVDDSGDVELTDEE